MVIYWSPPNFLNFLGARFPTSQARNPDNKYAAVSSVAQPRERTVFLRQCRHGNSVKREEWPPQNERISAPPPPPPTPTTRKIFPRPHPSSSTQIPKKKNVQPHKPEEEETRAKIVSYINTSSEYVRRRTSHN